MEAPQYRPGLENVVASETTISYLDVDNEEIVLRGYDLIELAKQTTYLDVVGLILEGTLPTIEQRDLLEKKTDRAIFPSTRSVLHTEITSTTNKYNGRFENRNLCYRQL